MTSLPEKILQSKSEFNKVVALRQKKQKTKQNAFLYMTDTWLENVIK